MAKFTDLQAACAGFYRLFRREVFVSRYLIRQRMLFDPLAVHFGGLRPGRIPLDRILNLSFFRHSNFLPCNHAICMIHYIGLLYIFLTSSGENPIWGCFFTSLASLNLANAFAKPCIYPGCICRDWLRIPR